MTETFLPHELVQKISNRISEQNILSGLYIVSTPIGNIFDITLRAIFILNKSECIFAEDTRVAQKLLNFYGIKKKTISCNNYTELKESVKNEILKNRDGIFSIISDAGTPLISDPGYKLVNWCLENNIATFPIPGPCSAIAGLCVSGLPTDKFYFVGFLPNKANQRKSEISKIAQIEATLIFLESPNRLVNTLKDCLEILGNRQAFVGRELTKFFEKHQRGKISELIEFYENNPSQGEIVFAIQKSTLEKVENIKTLEDELKEKMRTLSLKEAVNQVHILKNVPKRVIYDLAIKIKNAN